MLGRYYCYDPGSWEAKHRIQTTINAAEVTFIAQKRQI